MKNLQILLTSKPILIDHHQILVTASIVTGYNQITEKMSPIC